MSADGFDNLLDQCLGVRAGEQVVLLTDDGTDDGVVSRLAESVAGPRIARGLSDARASTPEGQPPGRRRHQAPRRRGWS